MAGLTKGTRSACLLSALATLWAGYATADDLAKASQNPIGDMTSLPMEAWHYENEP